MQSARPSAGRDYFARFNANRGDHAWRIGVKNSVIEPPARDSNLCLGGIGHGLCRRQRLLGPINRCSRHDLPIIELALPIVGQTSFRKLAICRDEAGFGGAKSILFIGGIKTRDTLTGVNRIADIDQALNDPASDPESEFDLNLAFDRAGELNRLTGLIFLDGYDADEPGLVDDFLILGSAGSKETCERSSA